MSWAVIDVSDWLLQLVPALYFDRMIKRLSHGCFHVSPISSPLSTTSYRCSGLIYRSYIMDNIGWVTRRAAAPLQQFQRVYFWGTRPDVEYLCKHRLVKQTSELVVVITVWWSQLVYLASFCRRNRAVAFLSAFTRCRLSSMMMSQSQQSPWVCREDHHMPSSLSLACSLLVRPCIHGGP